MSYGKSKGRKSGGFVGNMAKIGGSGKKLALKTDMAASSMVHGSMKKGAKQAHKRA
jgi:hypothetical protein